MLSPDKFTNIVAHKIYEGLGEKCRVQVTNLTGDGGVILPSIIVSSGDDIYYAAPLLQVYMDYLDLFNGSLNAFCEDLCKKIENFNDFVHSDEEMEFDE